MLLMSKADLLVFFIERQMGMVATGKFAERRPGFVQAQLRRAQAGGQGKAQHGGQAQRQQQPEGAPGRAGVMGGGT